MHVPQVATPPRLLGHQLPERRGEEAEDVSRGDEHGPGQYSRVVRVRPAPLRHGDQGARHEDDVQQRLAHLRVDVRHGARERLQVLGEGVVGVGEAAVQVAHTVVGLVGEIEPVRVIDEAGSDGQGQLALQVADEAVDERGWKGDEEPSPDESRQLLDVHLDDRLDDVPVQLGDVDGEEGPGHEGGRVHGEETELLGERAGDRDLEDLEQLPEERLVHGRDPPRLGRRRRRFGSLTPALLVHFGEVTLTGAVDNGPRGARG